MTEDEMKTMISNFIIDNKELEKCFIEFNTNLNKDFLFITNELKDYLIEKKKNNEFKYDKPANLVKMCRMLMTVIFYNYLDHLKDYIQLLNKSDDLFEADKKDMH